MVCVACADRSRVRSVPAPQAGRMWALGGEGIAGVKANGGSQRRELASVRWSSLLAIKSVTPHQPTKQYCSDKRNV